MILVYWCVRTVSELSSTQSISRRESVNIVLPYNTPLQIFLKTRFFMATSYIPKKDFRFGKYVLDTYSFDPFFMYKSNIPLKTASTLSIFLMQTRIDFDIRINSGPSNCSSSYSRFRQEHSNRTYNHCCLLQRFQRGRIERDIFSAVLTRCLQQQRNKANK